ncbi:MAG: sigma-70 family RNA polymerase sigma factor [Planctomycetota bacterium]
MTSSAYDPSSHDELLRHTEWVQRLAGQLVGDRHEAEDVAQDAVLAVLRRDTPISSHRRFLFRVTQNLTALSLRRRHRRERRERAVSREEATPSALDLIERRALCDLVAKTVHDLPTHYREVLVRRFFEGHPPSAIALQLGIPVSTVKTRLARAQDKVRQRLSRLDGGAGDLWRSAGAALSGWPVQSRFAAAATAAGLAVAAVLPIALLVAWLARSAPVPAREDVVAHQMNRADAAGAGGPSRPGDDIREPSRIRTRPRATAAPLPTAGPGVQLRGRVVDQIGQGVDAVVVRLRPYPGVAGPEDRLATTDATGAFAFERYWPGGTIEVLTAPWTTVLAGETAQGQAADHVVLVAARPALISGRVVTATGEAIAGAVCTLALPPNYRSRFDAPLSRSATARFQATTGPTGAYQLTIPRVEGATLRFHKHGFAPRVQDAADVTNAAVVTLQRLTQTGPHLVGHTLDGSGQPRPGVLLTNGRDLRESARDGSFRIPLPEGVERVVAFDPQAGVAVCRADRAADRPWPDAVDFTLAPPREVHGQVVDERGRGIAGMTVWLLGGIRIQGTPAGNQGADAPTTVERRLTSRGQDGPDAVTDAAGAFVIGGLLPVAYSVLAVDPARLTRSAEARIPPTHAAPVTLTVDRSAVRDVVRGIVVDTAGQPLRGLDVRPVVRLPSTGAATPLVARRAAVKTDGAGSFLLRGVARDDVSLEVRGPGVLTTVVPLATTDQPVCIERAALLRVELVGFRGNETFAVLSHDGKPQQLHRAHGSRAWTGERAALPQGRSETIAVGAHAARVVAYRGTTPIASAPLTLRPGERSIVLLHAE